MYTDTAVLLRQHPSNCMPDYAKRSTTPRHRSPNLFAQNAPWHTSDLKNCMSYIICEAEALV